MQVAGKIFEVHSYPIEMPNGGRATNVVNQYIDVTQSKQTYLKMLQAEKMSAVGLLAGNIAHELNNPLTGLRSLAQVLIAETQEDPQLQADLKEVEKAAKRSQDIIINLLEFSGSGPKELKITTLDEIVERTMPMLKTVTREHRVALDLNTKEYSIKTSPQLLQQVFFNLVTNACQAMKQKGELTITTNLSSDHKWIQLQVEDNGPGIPLEIQEKIFEAFFTTKEEGQGTGLGLSLSREIVKNLGGEILLKSTIGQGTEFTVRFPNTRSEKL
jgi:signal transduction histidine kinase